MTKAASPKLSDLCYTVILLFHDLFLLGSALAIVPKTRRSLSEALQIHEAGEPHKLGICIIITGRRKGGTLYHWKG